MFLCIFSLMCSFYEFLPLAAVAFRWFRVATIKIHFAVWESGCINQICMCWSPSAAALSLKIKEPEKWIHYEVLCCRVFWCFLFTRFLTNVDVFPDHFRNKMISQNIFDVTNKLMWLSYKLQMEAGAKWEQILFHCCFLLTLPRDINALFCSYREYRRETWQTGH